MNISRGTARNSSRGIEAAGEAAESSVEAKEDAPATAPPPLLLLPFLLRHLCLALDTFCYGIFATDDAVAVKPRLCRRRRRRRLC